MCRIATCIAYRNGCSQVEDMHVHNDDGPTINEVLKGWGRVDICNKMGPVRVPFRGIYYESLIDAVGCCPFKAHIVYLILR